MAIFPCIMSWKCWVVGGSKKPQNTIKYVIYKCFLVLLVSIKISPLEPPTATSRPLSLTKILGFPKRTLRPFKSLTLEDITLLTSSWHKLDKGTNPSRRLINTMWSYSGSCKSKYFILKPFLYFFFVVTHMKFLLKFIFCENNQIFHIGK